MHQRDAKTRCQLVDRVRRAVAFDVMRRVGQARQHVRFTRSTLSGVRANNFTSEPIVQVVT